MVTCMLKNIYLQWLGWQIMCSDGSDGQDWTKIILWSGLRISSLTEVSWFSGHSAKEDTPHIQLFQGREFGGQQNSKIFHA